MLVTSTSIHRAYGPAITSTWRDRSGSTRTCRSSGLVTCALSSSRPTPTSSGCSAFGATIDADAVVEETLFVADMEAVLDNIEAIARLRERVLGGAPAVAQTLVRVAGLNLPGLILEIRCLARLDGT